MAQTHRSFTESVLSLRMATRFRNLDMANKIHCWLVKAASKVINNAATLRVLPQVRPEDGPELRSQIVPVPRVPVQRRKTFSLLFSEETQCEYLFIFFKMGS